MPSMLMLQDSMFPRFTSEVSDSEKLDTMHDYLYQLLEQLRYTLTNLGAENFNTTELTQIGEDITEDLNGKVRVISETLVGINGTLYGAATGDGIVARLKSNEGSVTELTATAAELKTQLTDAKNNITEVSQTATTLEASIVNNQNAITELQATASGITTRVTSLETVAGTLEGDVSGLRSSVSTLEQDSNSIKLKVTAIEGDMGDIEDAAVEAAVAEIETMAEEISMSVTNSGTSSTITLNAFGTEITSGEIKLTGFVTIEDLEGDETTINGDNITTGTITGTDYVIDSENNNGITFKYGTLECGYIKLIKTDGAPYLYIGTYNKGVGLILEADSAAGVIINSPKGYSWQFLDDGIYYSGNLVISS